MTIPKRKSWLGRILIGEGRTFVRFRNANILLFTLALFLMIAAMLAVFNGIIRQVSLDFAGRYGASSSNSLSSHIEKEIGLLAKAAHSESLIEWLADEEDPDKKALAHEEMAGILRELYSNNLYVGIEKSRQEYEITESSAFDGAPPFAVLDPDEPADAWYYLCLESDRDYLLSVNIDYVLQRKRVWLDYKISKDGVPLGVICTGLDFPRVAEELFALSGNLQTRGLIIDEHGMILIDSLLLDSDHFMTNLVEIQMEETFTDRVLLAAVQSHLDRIDGVFEEEYEPTLVRSSSGQYQYATITPIRHTGWSAVILYDSSSLLGMSRFLPALTVILLVLFAFALAVNSISFKLIFKPLDMLTGSLTRLKENHEEHLYGIERDDEIGVLSNTILDLFAKANYDALTGIYNRRFMETNLQQIMEFLSRSNGVLSILMVDVDFFKLYNDTYGHQEGDRCLRMVARSLDSSVTRTNDFAARYGGEEFVVVLPNTDEAGVHLIAKKMLENVQNLNIPHAKSAVAEHITVSIGVTTGKVVHSQSWEEYVKRADEALYMSKQSGRNKYTFLSFSKRV